MAKCGCGRSNTGDCIGWHKLTEEEFKIKQNALNEKIEVTEEKSV